MTGAGFPHSEIFGSKRACRSPKLIAACCVLRRLMKPRHPSIAVTGLCKRSHILGVYFTHLHLSITLNFQRTKFIISQTRPHPPSLRCPSPPSPKLRRASSAAQPDGCAIRAPPERRMVGPDGLEPSTPRLSSACSNQLSYEPRAGNRLSHWNWLPPCFAHAMESSLRSAGRPASCSSQGAQAGGADEIRTRDPLLAKQVLYQLSYDPSVKGCSERTTLEIYFVRSTETRTTSMTLRPWPSSFDHRPFSISNLRFETSKGVSLERR